MGAVLYWFSGTGNSLTAARRVAGKLPGAELVRVDRSLLRSPPALEADVLGFVYPVYAGGMPRMMRRLLESAEDIRASYVFGLATSAGGLGRGLLQLRDILLKRGRTVDGLFHVRMPNNSASMGRPPTEEVTRSILDSASPALTAAAESVRSRSVELSGRGGGPYALLSRLASPLFISFLPKIDRGYFATDACTSCGTCVSVCPACNIELREGRPAWLGRCEACQGCIAFCPTSALQMSRRTVGRQRYHHPEVNAGDMGASQDRAAGTHRSFTGS